ncbi:sensor domain-containing diguanylate cyclase [Lysinibacillus fusiformis]|uniref:sensor domain-containing diguanylate cyclase n=1 Tax=Lysinibacillus fusiformis TaxID=28031 RepID=UPI0023A9259A|nr:sensor domain-containing diguanylate cyclase [Lysinibacillus fusiformis]WEA38271.1 sensor domain-containing diguanylate cyclase [Lysinibacillus fusiformis]
MEQRLNDAPCGFLSITHEGVIAEVNHTLLNWIGFEQVDLLQQHLEILLSTANKLIFHSYFYPMINLEQQVEELFIHLKHKEGMAIPFLMNARLYKEDTVERIDCILVKMQKRIDYEQELRSAKKLLEAAYQEKEQALANLEQIHVEIEQQQAKLLAVNATLIELSETDKLTGLKNRRFFQDKLEQQLNSYYESAKPFSLCILDIDHFKKVNDTFGHQVGDDVLAQLAQLLTQRARKEDTVARYGGEEFVMILPDTEIAAAKEVGEQIRKTVAFDHWPAGQVTISIGMATVTLEDTGTTLLKNADDALYASKKNGRNQVTHFFDMK